MITYEKILKLIEKLNSKPEYNKSGWRLISIALYSDGSGEIIDENNQKIHSFSYPNDKNMQTLENLFKQYGVDE